MDNLIYFKFISNEIGFGVFALINILANTIIGEYNGLITDKYQNKCKYAWSYNTEFKGFKPESIFIDGNYNYVM